MFIFKVCFVLYFVKLSAGKGSYSVRIIKTLLRSCCYDCAQILESAPLEFSEYWTSYNSSEKASLAVPVSLSTVQADYYDGSYVPILWSPVSVYVKKKGDWRVLSKRLITALFDSWPVTVMALLLSLLSGIIIWFLETWFNQEQFPRMFLRGSWEGFWWAFVSMTTVGYGDRAPSSFLGRSFAVIWIMIGVSMCSIFTASLTSALTNQQSTEEKTINRVKVGVMDNSLEEYVGLKNRADVVYYNSTEEMWKSLLAGEVEGILLDYYYSATNEIMEKMDTNELTVVNVFKSEDWSHGAWLPSKNLTTCMKNMYNKDYTSILFDAINNEQALRHAHVHKKATSELSGVFDSKGSLFNTALVACIACAVGLFILGFFMDLFCNKNCFWRRNTVTPSKRGINKLEKMEQEICAEIHSVFTSWKEKTAQGNGPLVLENFEREGKV